MKESKDKSTWLLVLLTLVFVMVPLLSFVGNPSLRIDHAIYVIIMVIWFSELYKVSHK